jgi:TonB family protein
VAGSLLLTAFAPAARAADPAAPEPVNVEVFQPARPLTAPRYTDADIELSRGKGGWVLLNMMIDPQGKPYEVNIVDSSGNAVLDAAAVKAVDVMKFQAARDAGKPIDSSLTFKMRFYAARWGGASNKFVHTYERLSKAVDAGDKAQADAELQSLQALSAENPYEDVYKGYAQYIYDARWGAAEQQLADLRRSLAGEDNDPYLPRNLRARALTSEFALEVSSRDYGAALSTWKRLKPIAPSPDRIELQKTVEQLMAVRNSSRPLVTAGSIGDTGWNGWLFKDHFFVAVKAGVVSEIKLRCQKKYVSIKYQPDIQYTVQGDAGDCDIQVVGDPGTKFDLVQ